MTAYWSDNSQTAILIKDNGLRLLTEGDEYAAAVAAGPLPASSLFDPSSPDPRPAPDPKALLAASVGLTLEQLEAVIAAAT